MLDDISAVSSRAVHVELSYDAPFTGQDLGQGEPGNGEDVSRRSPGEAASRPAFSVRVDPHLGRRVSRAT